MPAGLYFLTHFVPMFPFIAMLPITLQHKLYVERNGNIGIKQLPTFIGCATTAQHPDWWAMFDLRFQ